MKTNLPNIERKTKFFLSSKLLFLFFLFTFLNVAAMQAVNRYSVASGSWGLTSTWSATSGGASGASVPVAGDTVFIEGGFTVTIDKQGATVNYFCASVTVGTTTVGTLRFNSNSNLTLTVSGNVIVTNSSSLIVTNASSGNIHILKIGGDLTVTSGNTLNMVTANDKGNIDFNGTIAQTFTGGGTITLNAITVSNTNASGVTFANAVTVGATTTVNSGSLLALSATLTTTGVATINGTLALNTGGTISAAPTYTSTSTLTYKSANITTGNEWNSTGTVAGVGVPHSVTVNLVANTNAVTLAGNRTVPGTLTLTNGLITTGANTLTASTVSGGSTNSYVNGILAKVITTTTATTFQVGKGGNYRPIVFTYAAAPGTKTVTVEQFESIYPGTALTNVSTARFSNRYWNITQSATGIGYTVGLNNGGFTPVGTPVMIRREGTGTNTSNATTFSSPNYTNSSTFSTTNVSNDVALGETAIPLTVTGAVAANKVYDKTNAATISGTLTTVVSPDVVTLNGTGTFAQVNVGTGIVVTSTSTLTGANAGAYTLTQPTGLTANITARPLTITGAANSKTYDATTSSATNPTVTSGTIQSGDTAAFTQTYDTKNVGTSKTMTPTGVVTDGNSGNNYTYTFVNSTNGTITARALTITGAANSKTYDGTTSSATNPTVTSGTIQSGDTAAFTQTYDTKNVGTSKTMTPTGVVTDGNSGNNYTYTFVNSTNGTITARALTITGAANSKTYDGTTSSATNPTVTSGTIQSGDTAAFTQTYNNKNVGTSKTMTPAGVVTDGNSGNNYSYTFVTSANGTITTRALTVTGAANSKTFDATTSSATNPTVTSGAIQTGDTAAFTQTYDTKNVGTGKTMTPTGVVTDGNSGNNYTYTFVNSTNGTITARALTITGAANSKTYDGTTSSVTNPTVTSGTIQSGDTAAFTQTYDTKNVGTGKTMTPTGVVTDGNSGNNYSYTFVTSANGTITARAITVTGAANSKTYDGNTSSATNPTVTSGTIQSGDTAAFTQTYDTKNVGTGKTMTPAGVVTDGNSGNNYSYTFVTSTNGIITTIALTITANDASKCFGTTYALGTSAFTSSGLLSGETIGSVTLTSSGASSGAAVGTYSIVPSAATGGTFLASNYTITYTSGTLTVNALPTAPTGTDGSRCSTGTVGLSATVGGGQTVDWYDASSGGTLLLSGSTSYTTPSISTTTLYYAEARNTTTGCVSSTRTTITATVYPTSVGGTVTGGTAICSGSTSGLLTLSGNTGAVVRWEYSVSPFSSWTTIANTTATYTSGPLTQTTQFRAVVQSGVCSEANSGATTVSINITTWNGSSWDNGTPTSTTAAVFTGNATIGADLNACSLTVNSSAVVSVTSGFDVTLYGALTVSSGSFTLNNTANLIQNGTNFTNSGNIIVKRNSSALKRLDYTLWSSPVTGQGLYAFSPFTFANRFYVYNTATNLYNNAAAVGFNITGLNTDGVNGTDSNNVQFASAKGYLIRMPWDHPTTATVWNGTFTGVPNNGDVTFAMTTGYNAVGNPYPSRINVHNFIDGNTNISGPLYLWRKTNDTAATSYATLTKTAYVANGAAGGDTGTGYFNTGNETNWVLNIGQGFIVNATSSTNLTFTNSMRRSLNADQFFRTSLTTTSTNSGLYWLNLNTDTGIYSQMAVGYSPEGTLAEDRGIDGKNINHEFYLTSLIGADEYSIQGRPDFQDTDIVPLSYKTLTAGNYTISIDHTAGLFNIGSQSIYLKDNVTNTINNLNTGVYAFTSTAGTFNTRFEIVYQSQLGNPTFTANTVVIYNQNNEFVVNSGNFIMSSIKVFDIRGRLIEKKSNINASQATIKGGLANEVLLVQITSVDGEIVTKKVVR